MRLNFSGSDEDAIREGIRRIGKVVKRAGRALRHAHRRAEPPRGARPERAPARGATPRRRGRASTLPRARRAARPARRRLVSRVAVLKGGRSLERQVSLRSGARVEDALERLGHDVRPDRRRRRPDRAAARGRARRRVRRAARPRRRGRHGAGAARDPRHPLHRARACSPACAAMDKVLAKHLLIEAGIPTPEFFAFNETAFRELGAAEALPAIEERLDFPIVVKPVEPGLGARASSSRARPADVPAALVAAFSYDAAGAARAPRRRAATSPSRCSTGADGPEALPIVEAVPRDEDFYDFEARYEIGRTDFVCPADAAGRRDRARAASSRSRTYELLGCYGFARVDLMLDDGAASSYVLEANADPGPHRDEPAAAGRRGGRHRLRRSWSGGSSSWRSSAEAALARLARAASLAPGEVLGRDVVEEVLELLDDLLLVLHLVLELDRGLGDDVLGGEDRGARCAPRGRGRRRGASRSRPRGRSCAA